MAHTNLTPQRGPSVWTRQADAARLRGTVERAVAGSTGLLLLLLGARRRTLARTVVTAAGATLLVLAAAPRGMQRVHEWTDRQRWRRAHRDPVTDQSVQSFPASDAPAWTATTASARPAD
jgi:uncharacterized membrane protein